MNELRHCQLWWNTATEILVSDPWLRVRADGGALNGGRGVGRVALGFLYMNSIMAHFPPRPGAQPWEDVALALTTQGRDLGLQQHKPISEWELGFWKNPEKWKMQETFENGVYVEFETSNMASNIEEEDGTS